MSAATSESESSLSETESDPSTVPSTDEETEDEDDEFQRQRQRPPSTSAPRRVSSPQSSTSPTRRASDSEVDSRRRSAREQIQARRPTLAEQMYMDKRRAFEQFGDIAEYTETLRQTLRKLPTNRSVFFKHPNVELYIGQLNEIGMLLQTYQRYLDALAFKSYGIAQRAIVVQMAELKRVERLYLAVEASCGIDARLRNKNLQNVAPTHPIAHLFYDERVMNRALSPALQPLAQTRLPNFMRYRNDRGHVGVGHKLF